MTARVARGCRFHHHPVRVIGIEIGEFFDRGYIGLGTKRCLTLANFFPIRCALRRQRLLRTLFGRFLLFEKPALPQAFDPNKPLPTRCFG